jgi:hypothetical protein
MAAEYMDMKNTFKLMGTETTPHAQSYYLSASYAFNNWFTLGVYYAEYYPDKDDKEGNTLAIKHNAWEKDLALTLRFDINDYWIFKIEGHTVDGTANVLALDNANNAFSESKWYYGAAKVSFSF